MCFHSAQPGWCLLDCSLLLGCRALGCRRDIAGCNEDTESAEYTCEFYAQGYCPYGRAMAYYQHVDNYYAGAHNHSILVVPRVGHAHCRLFQSPRVRGQLFSSICASPVDTPE